MHTDEAVNAYIIGGILAGENYHYDPTDRHGPALSLAALPFVRFAGATSFARLSETTLRCVPVVWGALTLLLFAALVRHAGLLAASAAALLLAIGALPVYYSRYFIHETLFITGTLGFLLSGWRALESKSLRSGVLVGVTAGFMLACKETAVLHFAAFGVAGLWWLLVRRREGSSRRLRWNALVGTGCAALVAFAVVILAFYSWGGRYWRGPLDLASSIGPFASRAAGQGHEKPFWYYAALLAQGWSGKGVLVLAGIGGVIVARTMPRTGRESGPDSTPLLAGFPEPSAELPTPALSLQALLIYAIIISLLYSAIPYKTPWLALNLWLPMIMLAGIGFASLWQATRKTWIRLPLMLAACALVATLGRDTWQRVFVWPSDDRNPYAYAHTVDDLLRLPARLEQLVPQTNPAGDQLIAVCAADPWPLPWYLRKFPRVGYWQPGQDPGPADIYITSPEAAEKLAPRLANRRMEFFGLRPEVLIFLWPPPHE
jgi:uncharacterized protein (TIGR03663 family)